MLRLLSRLKSRQPGIDDWAMVAAMVSMPTIESYNSITKAYLRQRFVIPLSALAIVRHGLGKDIWSIPFESITAILYIYYFDEVLYLGSLMMIRLSMLCLYLRMFPQRGFKRIIYAIIAINIIYSIAFIVASVFQCIPVQAAWTRWDGTVPAKCINANAVGWSSAFINIVLHAIIIILPLPMLMRLLMSWEQNIQTLIMFGLGSLVIIVSILRLTMLVKFANTQNITWDYVPVGYWSTIEVHVSVICACLPALPSLFHRKAPVTPRQNSLQPGPIQTVGKPKNRDSDILPLLKIVSVHEQRVGLSQ
ncbi:hypothetical protein HYALB_00005432 [Hymenoscyphus albidus]|uniref:Rhodopsin domain-containing protein n=1 Tax=Hymenoscyphus albidus TaxID=595503 RepID=A0A9N9Q2X9_9HELO|nr:hypothetical protein HYALB_00005432 [Hymenoscyphus albidus]